MRPVLLSLWLPWLGKGIAVYSYPTAQLVGLALAVGVGMELCRREGIDRWRALTPFLVGVPLGLVGARVLAELSGGTWMARPRWGVSWYWQTLRYWHGGKAAYGGLLAGVGAGLLGARAEGLSAGRFADAVAPGLALGVVSARVGCFLAGCCYGRPTDSLLAVRFPPDHPGMVAVTRAGARGLHPTELYLAAAALGTAVLLSALHRVSLRTGARFCLFALLYAAVTFAVEFLRGDPGRGNLKGLSVAQWISLVVIAAGIAWLRRGGRSRPPGAVSRAKVPRVFSRRAAGLAAFLFLPVLAGPATGGPTPGGRLRTGGWRTASSPAGRRSCAASLPRLQSAGPLLGSPPAPVPHSPAALLARAVGQVLRGEIEAAVTSLRLAAGSDHVPTASALAAVALGRTLLPAGRPAEAEDAFRSLLARHPDSTLADDAALGIARTCEFRGHLAAARRQVEVGLARPAAAASRGDAPGPPPGARCAAGSSGVPLGVAALLALCAVGLAGRRIFLWSRSRSGAHCQGGRRPGCQVLVAVDAR